MTGSGCEPDGIPFSGSLLGWPFTRIRAFSFPEQVCNHRADVFGVLVAEVFRLTQLISSSSPPVRRATIDARMHAVALVFEQKGKAAASILMSLDE